MESISIIKGATTVKKEAEKVQRQKSFFLHKYHMLLFSALSSNLIRYNFRPKERSIDDVMIKLLAVVYFF